MTTRAYRGKFIHDWVTTLSATANTYWYYISRFGIITRRVPLRKPQNNSGTGPPRIEYSPVRVFDYRRGIYCRYGHTLSGRLAGAHLFGWKKTLADCFKYRNKIGLDTAVEALQFYRSRIQLDQPMSKDMAASIRVRLLILTRAGGEDFDYVLCQYMMQHSIIWNTERATETHP